MILEVDLPLPTMEVEEGGPVKGHEELYAVMRQFSILVVTSCVYQFSSLTQSCPTLCDPMDCGKPGLPVHHQLPGLTQTHVH